MRVLENLAMTAEKALKKAGLPPMEEILDPEKEVAPIK
ncbi:unnamed protein product [Protopolystoma xenopodis]|uniref:Uncharacterized protein n=1 Tax=Protopolystoma xenopodis TaxID=117903 RepID=A0A448XRA2_9PLAT|nr:unnamed protein product [Protopolystoma xenopodis]